MLKDEVFFQSYFAALSGLLSNPQNVKAKTTDMVEQAVGVASYSVSRLSQVVSSFNSSVLYQVTAGTGTAPTQPTFTYSFDPTTQINKTPDTVKASVNPTAIRQPDDGSTSIAKDPNKA